VTTPMSDELAAGGSFRDLATIAVLGLGVIGRGMAGRVATSGFELVLWNRTAITAQRVALRLVPEDGNERALTAASPAQAAAAADLILLSLSDDDAVRSVLTSPDMLAALRPGTVVVDTSTVAPQTSQELAGQLASGGVTYVDAPVTGGAEKARDGTLTLLCGGPEAALAHAWPVLDLVAARVERFGEVGSGQLVKAVNQIILAGALAGVAEGIGLAEAANLDAGAVVAALTDGAATSWVLRERAPLMVTRDLAARGRIALHLKDLGIALQAASAVGARVPLTRLVESLEAEVADAGFGDEDVSALIRAYTPDPG
jgi:3-hydroxyisobutyrate dehydrogenase-like beta-hydroxyacid dehydrogenase